MFFRETLFLKFRFEKEKNKAGTNTYNIICARLFYIDIPFISHMDALR